MYSPVDAETLIRLWPDAAARPTIAWTHRACGLVVTNRADHDDPNGEYRCPHLRPNLWRPLTDKHVDSRRREHGNDRYREKRT